MSATLDKIIKEVRTLTPEEQQQLLEMLEQESPNSERARRVALARQIRGKYRDALSSSEEFIARKAEEVAEEDRRR
jgi:hypothetical protein